MFSRNGDRFSFRYKRGSRWLAEPKRKGEQGEGKGDELQKDGSWTALQKHTDRPRTRRPGGSGAKGRKGVQGDGAERLY